MDPQAAIPPAAELSLVGWLRFSPPALCSVTVVNPAYTSVSPSISVELWLLHITVFLPSFLLITRSVPIAAHPSSIARPLLFCFRHPLFLLLRHTFLFPLALALALLPVWLILGYLAHSISSQLIHFRARSWGSPW